MEISLKEIDTISSYGGTSFYLPNAIGTFGNGDIAILDGGNNRVCKFSLSREEVKSIGNFSEGLGDYRFKEPVALSISEGDFVFVSDWHNHRIIIFDKDLNYADEFGHYGKLNAKNNVLGFIRKKTGFFHKAAKKGNYIEKHFDDDSFEKKSGYSIWLLITSTVRNLKKYGMSGFLKEIVFDEEHFFDKPNGVTIFNGHLIVSQKNNYCLSVYDREKPFKLVTHVYGPKEDVRFGRLGNVYSSGKNKIYVCDERNSTIWILGNDLKLLDSIKGNNIGYESFMPFSCCLITDTILCVCGGLNLQFIDIKNKKVLYICDYLGELHGVAYDKVLQLLYVVDRSNSSIKIFRIELSK